MEDIEWNKILQYILLSLLYLALIVGSVSWKELLGMLLNAVNLKDEKMNLNMNYFKVA